MTITLGLDILHQRTDWRGGGVDDLQTLRGRETRTERRRIDAVGWHCWLLVSVACRLCSTAVKTGLVLITGNYHPYRGGSGGYCFLIVWELTDDNPIVDLSLLSRATSPSAVCVSASRICSTWRYCSAAAVVAGGLRLHGNVAGLASAPVGIIPVILSPIIGASRINWICGGW